MVDLTGADIRAPAGNTDAVMAVAIGVDRGDGSYGPIADETGLPVNIRCDESARWLPVTKTINTIGSQYFMFASLLNPASKWKHSPGTYFEILQLYMNASKTTNAEGYVRLGVVTRAGSTSSDVTFNARIDFQNGGNTEIVGLNRNFSPQCISCNPALLQGSGVTLNLTQINTTAGLTDARGTGTTIPGIGDIIIEYSLTTGTQYTIPVGLMYRSVQG